MAQVEVTGDLAGVLSLERQIVYAAARALTLSATQSQEAAINAIKATFTTRGSWYLPNNRFGVRIEPASKDRLEAVVKTLANWLARHETGEDKVAQGGGSLAIPFVGLGRPRTSRASKVRASLKPRALGSRGVVLPTKSGPVLFYRQGSRLTAFYSLERRARIRRRSTVIEPTLRTVQEKLGGNFGQALADALRTAK